MRRKANWKESAMSDDKLENCLNVITLRKNDSPDPGDKVSERNLLLQGCRC